MHLRALITEAFSYTCLAIEFLFGKPQLFAFDHCPTMHAVSVSRASGGANHGWARIQAPTQQTAAAVMCQLDGMQMVSVGAQGAMYAACTSGWLCWLRQHLSVR